jgi:hypothetical protein
MLLNKPKKHFLKHLAGATVVASPLVNHIVLCQHRFMLYPCPIIGKYHVGKYAESCSNNMISLIHTFCVILSLFKNARQSSCLFIFFILKKKY